MPALLRLERPTTTVGQYLPMGWLSRRRVPAEEESPIPVGMSDMEAAHQAVRDFLARPADGFGDSFESIEVVEVRSVEPEATSAGISLRWLQGDNKYGLLMPIGRLARQAGSLDGVAFYLRLAVDEPHESPPESARAWFADLPAGPY